MHIGIRELEGEHIRDVGARGQNNQGARGIRKKGNNQGANLKNQGSWSLKRWFFSVKVLLNVSTLI